MNMNNQINVIYIILVINISSLRDSWINIINIPSLFVEVSTRYWRYLVPVLAILRTEVSVVDNPPNTALSSGSQTHSWTSTASVRSKAWNRGWLVLEIKQTFSLTKCLERIQWLFRGCGGGGRSGFEGSNSVPGASGPNESLETDQDTFCLVVQGINTFLLVHQ